jgi:hypothetical protein
VAATDDPHGSLSFMADNSNYSFYAQREGVQFIGTGCCHQVFTDLTSVCHQPQAIAGHRIPGG